VRWYPPAQRENNAAYEWDDEDSEALFITAENAEKALEWGHAVAKRFVSALFNDRDTSWTQSHFAAWIDHDYASNFSREQLKAVPTVKYGEYPDIVGMIRSKYGETVATVTGLSI